MLQIIIKWNVVHFSFPLAISINTPNIIDYMLLLLEFYKCYFMFIYKYSVDVNRVFCALWVYSDKDLWALCGIKIRLYGIRLWGKGLGIVGFLAKKNILCFNICNS